jgi:phytanoyl-CoA hydroxylase
MLLPGALDTDLDCDLAEPLAHFAAHGWARVGRALTDEACALLRARADDLMLGRIVHDGLFFQLDAPTGSYDDLRYGKGFEGPSLDYRKVEKLELDPLFRALIESPLFERIARGALGSDGAGDIAIYRAVIFNKGPRGGSELPWHQDGGRFWGVDRAPTVQVWTALDDAPRGAGCLEVVPGTHARGLATPEGGVVPPHLLEAAHAEERALPLPARAGEVLLVHNHLWHRSGRAATGQQRRALTVCYMPATTRCLRTKRAPRRFTRVFARRQEAP